MIADSSKVRIPKRAFLPVYQHLLHSTADIDFYWGGRDSGKSQDIAQQLIVDCLRLPYFRCLLIKKTFNTIKESQWQTIKDIVENWGLSSLFTFRVAPLTIECINGNRFLARGCDDPQSIKSTKDPSHSWIEEANQLSLDDFVTVTTTLRTEKVKIKQRISFNPECDGDYEDFWLYETFFKGKNPNGTYKWTLKLPDGSDFDYVYTSTHTTYRDNPHCSPARIVFLEQLAFIEPYYYQVYTLGQWGRRRNNSPFVFAFDRSKHLAPTQFNDRFEGIISFDFNKSPIAAGIYQFYDNILYGIESIKLDNSDIYKLCDYILAKYPGKLWVITGDATGRNSSALVQNGIHYYTVIKEKLNLSQGQIRVPSVNPHLKENQVLVNAVLYQVKCIFDPVNCKALIFDFENVRVLADGSIEKKDRNDPAQQSDSLDHFRYMCNQFFKWVLKQ